MNKPQTISVCRPWLAFCDFYRKRGRLGHQHIVSIIAVPPTPASDTLPRLRPCTARMGKNYNCALCETLLGDAESYKPIIICETWLLCFGKYKCLCCVLTFGGGNVFVYMFRKYVLVGVISLEMVCVKNCEAWSSNY